MAIHARIIIIIIAAIDILYFIAAGRGRNVRRVHISSHAIDRWKERVGLKWSPGKICDYVWAKLHPRLKQGIKTYAADNKVFFVFPVGTFRDKFTLAVVTPDSYGLWSGWKIVTFITDDAIDDIGGYFRWLEERSKDDTFQERT
jgi:hypothetical protein